MMAKGERDLFDAWAGLTSRSLRDGYAASLQAAADALPLAAGSDLLVVGIGSGDFASLLDQRGVTIWGLDEDGAALDRLHRSQPSYLLDLGQYPIPHPAAQFAAVATAFRFHRLAAAERLAAGAELARVLQVGGYLCLLDFAFPSTAARAEASRQVADWDDGLAYPLVSDLDETLRTAGLRGLHWKQTAPCHWLVMAKKT